MDWFLLFAWCWILLGLVLGTFLGLRFADSDWLGGYATWPRRLIRLGHISFLGTGLLALAAHWTLQVLEVSPGTAQTVRLLFVTGAVSMPLICFLAAYRCNWRHAFAVPVSALLAATACLLLAILRV